MERRAEIGRAGEHECARELELRGWTVSLTKRNNPNIDLHIQKAVGGRELHWGVQVKTSMKPRGYVTGGGVNPAIVEGASIFNRVEVAEKCSFVIFLARRAERWRHFVVPVSEAEAIFRRNVDAYFKSPKRNGEAKRPAGQTDIFVGDGAFTLRCVPDQRSEIVPFECRWDLLELKQMNASRAR